MPEHVDDLESFVHEGADEETDTYPSTADELDDADESDDESDVAPQLDEDTTEL